VPSLSFKRHRRVWRVVVVGVGLSYHDGEIEGVVLEDDTVLVVGVRVYTVASHAMLKHMSQDTIPSPCCQG
jgi:hypothetical protein